MIKPVNGHLVIDPLTHTSFIQTGTEVFQEIGIVIATSNNQVPNGSKVYFDSWLAAKYPKADSPDQYYWLVKWEDVRAYEEVSE